MKNWMIIDEPPKSIIPFSKHLDYVNSSYWVKKWETQNRIVALFPFLWSLILIFQKIEALLSEIEILIFFESSSHILFILFCSFRRHLLIFIFIRMSSMISVIDEFWYKKIDFILLSFLDKKYFASFLYYSLPYFIIYNDLVMESILMNLETLKIIVFRFPHRFSPFYFSPYNYKAINNEAYFDSRYPFLYNMSSFHYSYRKIP